MILRKHRLFVLRRHAVFAVVLALEPVRWAMPPLLADEPKTESAMQVPVNRFRTAPAPLSVDAECGGESCQSKRAITGDAFPRPDSVKLGGLDDLELVPVDGMGLPLVESDDGMQRGDLGVQLVSDGWNARNATDADRPLTDPIPAKPSYALTKGETKLEQATKSVVTDLVEVKEVPSSTIRIVTPVLQKTVEEVALDPKPNAALDSATPGFKTDERLGNPSQLKKSPLASASPHWLFGPGAATRSSIAIPLDQPLDEISPTPNAGPVGSGDDLANAQPIHDPHSEHNEPVEANRSSGLSADSSAGLPPLEPLVEGDLPLATETDRISDPLLPSQSSKSSLDAQVAKEASDVAAKRLAVRDLQLGLDGSLNTKSTKGSNDVDADRMKPIDASRISNRKPADNSARQSIGDAHEIPLIPTPASGDRINSDGELILAIGMVDSAPRASTTTARLRVPIERTLSDFWAKPENAQERTYWGMFHNIMIFDKDTSIIDGKNRHNAVAWMAGNNPCRNQILLEHDARGIHVLSGVGLQGHQAQMLAVYGLIDVPASYPLYVGRKKFSVGDVVQREMEDCKSGAELTFTLIGLSHYVDSDSQWVASDGQDWDFERLIQEELSQPIVGAACGGTHRLMGFAHALRRRRAEGKPITGQWARADRYVKDFIAYTWQLQNRDGSMSTEWYEKPEDNGKIDRKVQTTGHMVEFLLTALPDDQLQSPQMLRSITFLVNTFIRERGHEWQVGPKGHALRALAMYYRRVFGRPDPWRAVSVARSQVNRSTR